MRRGLTTQTEMSLATAWIVQGYHSLKLSGSVFHRRGPAAAKHRLPKLLYVRRTTHFAVSAERSRRALASAVSWQSSARWAGAWPVRYWNTKTAILKSTRCRTGSQWSCRSIGVMWSRRRALVIIRAAAFCTDCRRLISFSGRPCSMALQCKPALLKFY